MSGKKIAILVGGNKHGGTEIATQEIARFAEKAGHDVCVIEAGNGNPYWVGASRIPVVIRQIAKFRPDMIHVQSPYLAPSGLAASRLCKVPYLFYERGGVHVLGGYNTAIYSYLVGQAARVVAQTDHQKAILDKWVGEGVEVEVIPNGVDLSRFQGMDKNEARKALGLPVDRKVVLALGGLRPEKNIEQFVRAATRTDVLYAVVGDGPQLEPLRKIAKGKPIVFFGAVEHEDIQLWLYASDMLVNTSKSEGFPMAVLEGLAAGLPIVAPRVCGIPSIIEDGVNGILTETGNVEDTRLAVEWMLGRPDVVERMGKANREKAEGYSWGNVVRRLYG